MPKPDYLKELEELMAAAERDEAYLSAEMMESISAKEDFDLDELLRLDAEVGLTSPMAQTQSVPVQVPVPVPVQVQVLALVLVLVW